MFSYRHQLVLCLGINCTIGYGTLLYSFSLLSLEIENTFSWSSAFIYGVYSLGILLGGMAAPFLGKALDRCGTRYPMAVGSLIMACCLYGLSIVNNKIEFVVYLLLLEILSILVLYESAFVAIVQAIPQKNNEADTLTANTKEKTRLSITQITLMAGFASTIFWPLIAYLLSLTHWRDVYVFMALLHLFICFPLHLYCLRSVSKNNVVNVMQETQKMESGTLFEPEKNVVVPKGKQWKTELLLALSFGGVAFCVNGLQIHIFSIMELLRVEHALAVLAGSLVGPFQVVSRVMDIFLSRRITPVFLGVISIVCMMCGLLFLVAVSVANSYSVLLFAVFFGMGQGLTNIVRGSIPFYLFGSSQYGAITGRINGVRIIMTAMAPVSLSMLMNHASVEIVIIILSVCMMLSLWVLVRLQSQSLHKNKPTTINAAKVFSN